CTRYPFFSGKALLYYGINKSDDNPSARLPLVQGGRFRSANYSLLPTEVSSFFRPLVDSATAGLVISASRVEPFRSGIRRFLLATWSSFGIRMVTTPLSTSASISS